MARNFNSSLRDLREYDAIRAALLTGRAPVSVSGCVDSELVQLAVEFSGSGRHILLLTYNEVRAKELYEDAQTFTDAAYLYPSKDLLFFDADIRGSLLTRQRMNALRMLLEKDACLIVSTVDALLCRMSAPALLKKQLLFFRPGDRTDVEKLCRQLAKMGYERTPVVEMPGEFALRGGILDIFLLTEENPVRLEFFDDEIDSLRSFDAESQRSIENLSEITIYPAGEDQDESASLLDYLSASDILVLDEPERMKEKADAVAQEYQESAVRRLEEASGPIAMPQLTEPDSLWERFARPRTLILTGLPYRGVPVKADQAFQVEARAIHAYGGHFDLLLADLKKWQRENYRLVLLSSSRSRAERLAGELADQELRAFFAEETEKDVHPGQVLVTYGSLHKSYAFPSIRFAVISEGDMFRRVRKKQRRTFSKGGQKVTRLSDLSVGDYVVHEDHGLGVFRGIERKIVDNIGKDYLKISYRDGGNLYAPVTQMDRIEKYASADADPPPTLNRLGGTEWHTTKARVKKAVGSIAKDLVALYAAREHAQGYVYGPDTLWQREFEEQFPYEETEDQEKAIEAVKKDMESAKIMDRLICGDVGFGKTEIAIRAAFKAVQESKQVAYLVPTTILAQQHFNTFTERMKEYPVRVELLSRFRTPAQQKKIVSDVKKGAVDIVIGTHRLLSADVTFKDLGLLIIDEEQRFGVADKEKIKKLKESVDVMSLTATPIPRTLHMSLIGIRDMSVLDEPPMDRLPIQTYIAEYNDEIVREAISRELARGGQVYFVSNKVKNIADVTAHVQSLVPDASVAFAHGQMRERELEQIMYDFVSGEIDVLVSTTIVETGLDIPNVNTIIIQDSDRYGLAQLYQLRGRVGRSNRTAYAFLFYRGGRVLKEIAEKRLQAIRDYTELGSGVRISMRDLELRGAGNLLGAEQHGHMESVGYDLYCKMLGAAVREVKGEAEDWSFTTSIDLSMDANLPASYIPNENQKMDIYRRIAEVQSREDYEDRQDELIDRFGNIPKPAEHLLKIALLKALAHTVYITELTGNSQSLTVRFLPQAKLDGLKLMEIARDYKGAMKLKGGEEPGLTLLFKPGEAASADALLLKTGELLETLKKALSAQDS